MSAACLTIILAGALLEGLVEDGRGGRVRLRFNDGQPGLQSAIDFSGAKPQTFWRGEILPPTAEYVSAIGSADKRYGPENSAGGRDVWALLFAAMLGAASKQTANQVATINFIAPPGLSKMDKACLIVAGHLAGASSVEIGRLANLLSTESGVGGGVHLLCQFDADIFHAVCLDLGQATDKGMEADWSESQAGGKIAAQLVKALDVPQNISPAVTQWALSAMPARATEQPAWFANDRGPPFVAQMPLAALTAIADQTANLVCEWIGGYGQDVGRPDVLHLHGGWADLLSASMQTAFPDAKLIVSRDLSAPLDYAVAPGLVVPRLKGSISAAATGALSVQTDLVLTLVPSGVSLPHVRVNDSIETGLFLQDFGLFYSQREKSNPIQIGVIDIPTMLEQVSHSRIVTRILADTDDHLIYTTTLGQGLSSQGAIFDKRRKVSEPIASEMLDALGYV